MNAIADIIAEIGNRTANTPDQQTVCDDILDAAQQWAEGALHLMDVESVGDGGSRSHARFRAWITALPNDPRKKHLAAAIDALIAMTSVVQTRQGTFEYGDLPRGNER